MPELPEVETIRKMLVPRIEGRVIAEGRLRLPRMLTGATPKALAKALAGNTLVRLLRRGKYLIAEMERGSLIIHLGMTGQLTYAPKDAPKDPRFIRTLTGLEKPLGAHPIDKHTHLVITFEGGDCLLFRDPRTFGKLIWMADRSWRSHPRIELLGPEPFDLKGKALAALPFPATSLRPVKALLLDQSFLAGIGNIYADEALFLSGIHPETAVRALTRDHKEALLKAVQTVLRKGVKFQGTSFSDYRKPDGSTGSNYERLLAYGRAGKPCKRCGSLMVKTVVAQRGTVFCPACQVLSR